MEVGSCSCHSSTPRLRTCWVVHLHRDHLNVRAYSFDSEPLILGRAMLRYTWQISCRAATAVSRGGGRGRCACEGGLWDISPPGIPSRRLCRHVGRCLSLSRTTSCRNRASVLSWRRHDSDRRECWVCSYKGSWPQRRRAIKGPHCRGTGTLFSPNLRSEPYALGGVVVAASPEASSARVVQLWGVMLRMFFSEISLSQEVL